MSFKNIADNLINELSKKGIEAYIWHIATTGSIYVRFQDNRIGSVRIANHEGKSRLKYKYNLRSDMHLKKSTWIKDGDSWRFYLPVEQWKLLIDVLVERSKMVQSWENKYNYTIPKFKKKK
ncbi:hypothetical protein CHRYSEOSP005_07170 [Chryseobacterium sp. Alg-005]|uniref:hypothetical protein n=1 Tax=Chryseobacterium sp. Alg-005 TaxID=3159516 RepID=UPI003555AB2A